jgi:hypothetical protein
LVVACVATTFIAGAAAAAAKPSPKAAFNARVRAIGTQAQQALLAMPAEAAPSPGDQAAMADQLQAIYERVVRRLAALTPPKAIKADFRILLASYQAAGRNAGAWRDALLHGTTQQAADASGTLYLSLATYRASAALVRMSHKGYYFGTYFR